MIVPGALHISNMVLYASCNRSFRWLNLQLSSMQFSSTIGQTTADWHYTKQLYNPEQPCETGNCVRLIHNTGDTTVQLFDIQTDEPFEVEDPSIAANALASILGGRASAFAYDLDNQDREAARHMLQHGHQLTIPDGYIVGRTLGLLPPQ